MSSDSMGRWTSILVYGFGSMLTIAGLGGIMTATIAGFVGGIILSASGLILMPQTRSIVTGPISYAGGPDLSGIGTGAVILIVIVGTVAGTAIVPTADTEQTTTVPASTETRTAQPTATSTNTPEPTTPTPEATTTHPSTPAPTATPTPTAEPSESLEDGLTVTIVDVIDGDTMDIRMPDGNLETIRLLGVDTPATSVTQTSPDEWEGIPDTTDGRDWLANWGDEATSYAEDRLAGEEVVIQTDPESDQRGYYGRLLVYVYQDQSVDTSFNMRLIENGYARYYSSSFSMADEYQSAESDAQSSDTGVWDYSAPDTPTESSTSGSPDDIVVAGVHADADGNDHDNLNDEYIVLRNSGDSTINMGGWTLSDSADHTYYFPSGFSLGPGESVTIYTGSGSDSGSELYWGSSSAIWNNGGDTIIVVTDDGDRVINYEY